jgi:predicted dithiol-disulfide oxidoreductase (DUF899 family)
MPKHEVVTRDAWVAARKALLAKEKEFTRARDALSAERRELPWVKVEEPYAFETTRGKKTLAELFEGRSQLVVYHFMFDPSWADGCKSCSFWADNFDRNVVHLNHRDVTMIAVSRAPLEKLEAYKKRMGWSFDWASSLGTSFNHDYHVTITQEEIDKKTAEYNYAPSDWAGETPGISVFFKDEDGAVYHTYSCYSRGLDMMNAGYHYLDLVPKGRDEADFAYGMEWLRRRDQY